MKKILVFALAVAAMAAAKADYNDIKPGSPEAKAPTAVAWQNANAKAIAEATSCETLAALAATPSASRILLAKLRGAYATDPMVMTQVGALSQWVMEADCPFAFWRPSRAAARKVWVRALIEAAETAADDDIKTICLDQLRWCGCPCRRLVARVDFFVEIFKIKGCRKLCKSLGVGQVAYKIISVNVLYRLEF